MREIIIIKTSESGKIRNFLNQEGVNYEVFQEPQRVPKTDIFANYGQAIKDKEREKELKLWDNVDLDEQLNNDDEWWN